MDVGADFVVARDDERREVLLVDGRVAEGRGGHTGGGDAGYLGASLDCAGEVRHYELWMNYGLVDSAVERAPAMAFRNAAALEVASGM